MVARRPGIAMPWGRYTRARRVFWRVRVPTWAAAAGAGWAIGGAVGLGFGMVTALLAEVVFSYRRVLPAMRGVRLTPEKLAEVRAERDRREQRWAKHATPSPAGWTAPAGSVPGWNWTPPDGARERLDRVPGWVRVLYRTPFADRYAHAWMWRHGGWDVLPPGA